MADKKLRIAIIVFLATLCGIVQLICGCASQVKQTPQMDSIHYTAQVQQGYPCPNCGVPIPDKDVSPNTRDKNTCPNCLGVFFGKPERKSNKSQDKPYQGPNVLARGYHHDIKHDGNTKYSVKNNWDVSDDGNSGSMSSTTTITHEYNVKGEYGRTIGAAGLGRYGGY